MKTAAKIFIILGMIIGFWMVTPIIFGAIALSKLKKAREKKEITAISILTLIFCSTLGGIFMLCIPASAFPGKEEPQPVFNPYQQPMQAMPQQPMYTMPQQPMYTAPQQPMYTMPQQPMQPMQQMPQQPMPQQNVQYTAPQAPQAPQKRPAAPPHPGPLQGHRAPHSSR